MSACPLQSAAPYFGNYSSIGGPTGERMYMQHMPPMTHANGNSDAITIDESRPSVQAR